MINLHKFNSAWGLPDISPFCIKVETYFRIRGLDFQTTVSDATKAPTGKLPRIEHDGQTISDSSAIVEYFEAGCEEPLDRILDERQRAVSVAMKAMLEEQLYFVMLWQCWVTAEGVELYRPEMYKLGRDLGYPGFVLPIMFWFLSLKHRIYLWGQGTGRHDSKAIWSIGAKNLNALSDWLGDQKFMHGDRPTTVDATVYGFLARILWSPFKGPLLDAIHGKENLVSYCDRMRRTYYEDDAQQAAAGDV